MKYWKEKEEIMRKKLLGITLGIAVLSFFSKVEIVRAEDMPIQENKTYSGKFYEDVVFLNESVFAMPAEIVLDQNQNCHVFGFVALDDNSIKAGAGQGMLKRLVCKDYKGKSGFTIWNIKGDFQKAGLVKNEAPSQANTDKQISGIPLAVVSNDDKALNGDNKPSYVVKGGLAVTINVASIETPRTGSYIYLYAHNLTPKPFKIQLADLPSFGGKPIEEMPKLQQ